MPLCDENLHREIYDSDIGETVCGKCGLVLSEMQIEFEIPLTIPPRKRVSHYKTTQKPCLSSEPKIEAALVAMIEKRETPADLQERVLAVHKALHSHGMIRGYPALIISEAIVYTAFRMNGITLNLSEFTTNSAKLKSKVISCHREICRKLKLKPPRPECKDYLSYLVSKAEIGKEVEQLAARILAKAKEEKLLGGANPFGTAAAALYLACNKVGRKTTQSGVARLARVSEVTVRTQCKSLEQVHI